MKNQSIALLLIFCIASSDLLIASNAMHLQRNQAQFGLHLEQTLPTETVNQAASVVNEVKGVVEAFVSDNTMTKVAGAIKSLSKLGASLGALGSVLTVIDLFFNANQQSDVDIITNRIEATEIKVLNAIDAAVNTINIQSRKQQLDTAETKINSAASHLKNMRKYQSKPKDKAKNTDNFNYYKTQFVADAKDTEDYIQQIYNTFTNTFANGEPLLIAISRGSDGNWSTVKGAAERLTLLLIQAQINYSAYLNLKNKNLLKGFQTDFKTKLDAVAKFLEALPRKNFDIASASITNGLEGAVKTNCNNENGEGQNGACANILGTYYANKYPDLKFDIFVYNDESRDNKGVHAFRGNNCAWTQAQRKDVFLCYVSDVRCVNKVSSAQLDAQSRMDSIMSTEIRSGLRGAKLISPDICEKMLISDAKVKQQLFYRENAPTIKSSQSYTPSSQYYKSLGWLQPAFGGYVFEEAKPAGVTCYWTTTSVSR